MFQTCLGWDPNPHSCHSIIFDHLLTMLSCEITCLVWEQNPHSCHSTIFAHLLLTLILAMCETAYLAWDQNPHTCQSIIFDHILTLLTCEIPCLAWSENPHSYHSILFYHLRTPLSYPTLSDEYVTPYNDDSLPNAVNTAYYIHCCSSLEELYQLPPHGSSPVYSDPFHISRYNRWQHVQLITP